MKPEIILSLLGVLLSVLAVGAGLWKTIQKSMAEKKLKKYFIEYLNQNPHVEKEVLILLKKVPTDPESIRKVQKIIETIMEAHLNKKERKEISEGLYQSSLRGQGNYLLKFSHPSTEAFAR